MVIGHINMLKINMLDFDIILGMDCLYACYASIDCRIQLVTFKVSNEPIMTWEGGILLLRFNYMALLYIREEMILLCL